MGNKVMVVGFALSGLGLALFFPIIAPAGAIVLMVGAVLVVLDK